jgi:hypothetical protein
MVTKEKEWLDTSNLEDNDEGNKLYYLMIKKGR